MAKAVIEAAEIGAGILLLVTPSGLNALGWGLIMAGAAEELAFIAQEIQGNPSLTASAKLPSSPREGICGMTRKGGVFIYQSTTGHQLNEVICWAAHACQSIVALYIDQRKFFYTDDATLSQRSPFGGGEGDGNNYYDDSSNQYNFGAQTAAWHHCGWQCGTNSWSSGMTATRAQSGDTASTFLPTIIGVAIGGTTYAFGCVVAGTAGSSSSVFSGAAAVGSLVTDGGITWVNLGPAPGGYWFVQLYNQDTTHWQNNCTATGLCCTYFKATYDSNVFNGPSQLRATIQGKNNIYDPRTSTYGYTDNAALWIADMLCDPEFGFGAKFASVYGGAFRTQLIAAANLCDEQVQLADQSNPANDAPPWAPWTYYISGAMFTYGGATFLVHSDYTSDASFGQDDFTSGGCTLVSGGTSSTIAYESRYTVNGYFNSDQEPGQILSSMLMACEGRIVRQGGGYYIYPAAWYGTSLTFGANDLAGGVEWNPSRKYRDRVNCVRGTFVCPQYPYAIVGYSWDYKNPNIFAGEWQPTDAPPYAQDYLHGYGVITDPGQGDVNLVQDGGVRLYEDRRYQFVISAGQVQRLMKIYLMRNRFMGHGTFPMKLSALLAQAQDVISFTFSGLGMTDTYLEISKFDWVYKEDEKASGGQGARPVALSTQLELQLTDPSVYEWSTAEEMTLFDQPSPDLENPFLVSPPTTVAAVSDLATAYVAPDGTVTPRIELTWTEPADPFVTTGGSIQIQIAPHGTGAWVDVVTLAGIAHIYYIGNVVAAASYDVRIRGVRESGAYSIWVEIDNIVVGSTFNASGLSPVAPPGTLTAVTISAVSSTINVADFTAAIAGFTAPCVPSPSSLTGLTPQTTYCVYYVDPTFAGGTITPIATTNVGDFINKPGYFLIGMILTPAYVGGGSGTRYSPTNYSGLGQTAVVRPAAAYDGDITTFAAISGVVYAGAGYFGECLYQGFPSLTAPSGMNLYANLAAAEGVGSTTPTFWAVVASVGGGFKPAGQCGAFNPRGAWAATTAYAQWDTFTHGGVTYLVVTGYTSGGSFGSTDTANSCLVLASGTGSVGQANYTVPVPTGIYISGITVDVISNAPSPANSYNGVSIELFELYCS